MSMNKIRLTLAAALLAAGTCQFATAADMGSDAARQQRMDEAYQSYKGSPSYRAADGSQPSRVQRAENSIKRGAHKTGAAIERGAKKVGHAIGKGVRKTGEAIGRGGEKLEEKSATKP